MNYHIIKAGESIKMIAKNYELLEDEIIKNNKHITNWDKLIPGTRLKLPNISEKLADEIDEVEPFIEDYYPRIEVPIKEEYVEEPIQTTPLKPNNDKLKNKIPNPYYYPYYTYPNIYMYGNYYKRGNKKRSR